VVISQGDIWWADLPVPQGSEPGFRQPIVVVQADRMNRTKLKTVLCVTVTSNMALRDMPGCVVLTAMASGLPKDSIANSTQVQTLDRRQLKGRVGRLSPSLIEDVLDGVLLVLGK
jgi:mRNA interferase MazF